MNLRQLFPFAYKADSLKNMAIAILIFIVIGVVGGLVCKIIGIIPLIGSLVSCILGIIIGLYVLIGIVLSILNFLASKN